MRTGEHGFTEIGFITRAVLLGKTVYWGEAAEVPQNDA